MMHPNEPFISFDCHHKQTDAGLNNLKRKKFIFHSLVETFYRLYYGIGIIRDTHTVASLNASVLESINQAFCVGPIGALLETVTTDCSMLFKSSVNEIELC